MRVNIWVGNSFEKDFVFKVLFHDEVELRCPVMVCLEEIIPLSNGAQRMIANYPAKSVEYCE